MGSNLRRDCTQHRIQIWEIQAPPARTPSHPQSDSHGSESSGSDRDTYFNPDSSPKLPADLYADADRTAQAEFEEAVADSSYFADPDFEWEPGLEGS